MANFKETFAGNGAVTQATLEAGALIGGAIMGAGLLNKMTPLNISSNHALVAGSVLAAVGAVHGLSKGAAAQAQFNEQNTLINEAVHKGYIEESVEKVSHKVR